MEKLCEEEGFRLYMVSAKTGENLTQAYEKLLQMSYKYVIKQEESSRMSNTVVPVASKIHKDEKKKCC